MHKSALSCASDFHTLMDRNISGKVYLVGSGPGDPSLLTLRASELIRSCDVLVYDYLTHPLLRTWVKAGCELIDVGKQAGRHTMPQAEMEALLVAKAQAGKAVVRLKGGDPFIFGRGGEEAQSLQEAGIPFEVVPAVTAALSAAAYTGIPLTHRDHASGVTFITGHDSPQKETAGVDFRAYGKTTTTLCIYMGMGSLAEICDQLQEGGMPATTPLAIVQWATLPAQRSLLTNVGHAAKAKEKAELSSPAIIIIGDVARFYGEINWFEQRALFGRRVAVTRSREQASVLAQQLRDHGADVIELPLIAISEHEDTGAEEDVWQALGSYQWLVFSSANGVQYFFKKFYRRFADLRSIGGVRIACIGEATARAVREQCLEVDFIPADPSATAEIFAEELLGFESMENMAMLVVAGTRNRDALVTTLEKGQAIVDTFVVYNSQDTDLSTHPQAQRFREEGADAILFASSSTAENFLRQAANLALQPEARRPKTVSIGSQTSQKMRALGLPVDAEAKAASIPAMVEATIRLIGHRD